MQRPSYGSDAIYLTFTSHDCPGHQRWRRVKGSWLDALHWVTAMHGIHNNHMRGMRCDGAAAMCIDWDACCFQEWAALSQDCSLLWKTGGQAMLSSSSSSSSPITKATSRTHR